MDLMGRATGGPKNVKAYALTCFVVIDLYFFFFFLVDSVGQPMSREPHIPTTHTFLPHQRPAPMASVGIGKLNRFVRVSIPVARNEKS